MIIKTIEEIIGRPERQQLTALPPESVMARAEARRIRVPLYQNHGASCTSCSRGLSSTFFPIYRKESEAGKSNNNINNNTNKIGRMKIIYALEYIYIYINNNNDF
eukprot:gene9678-6776_t